MLRVGSTPTAGAAVLSQEHHEYEEDTQFEHSDVLEESVTMPSFSIHTSTLEVTEVKVYKARLSYRKQWEVQYPRVYCKGIQQNEQLKKHDSCYMKKLLRIMNFYASKN